MADKIEVATFRTVHLDVPFFRYIVYVNGKPIGFTLEPQELAAVIRGLRRARFVHEFVSVHCKHTLRCVHVVSDGGRLCRPYIIISKGAPLVTQDMLDVSLFLICHRFVTLTAMTRNSVYRKP